jgi:hypothetical protein
MIFDVSEDAGVEGEASVLHLLKGISGYLKDPEVLGTEVLEVEIIDADVPEPNPENGDGERIYGPELYAHEYLGQGRGYDYSQAVTIELSDKAVFTYG